MYNYAMLSLERPSEAVSERKYLLSEGVLLDIKTGRVYESRKHDRDTYDPTIQDRKILAPGKEKMHEYDKSVKAKGWILPHGVESKYRTNSGKHLSELRIGYLVMPANDDGNEVNFGLFAFQIEHSDINGVTAFYSPVRSQMDANHAMREESGLFMPSHSLKLPNIRNTNYRKLEREPDENVEAFETIMEAVRLRNMNKRTRDEYKRIVNTLEKQRHKEQSAVEVLPQYKEYALAA